MAKINLKNKNHLANIPKDKIPANKKFGRLSNAAKIVSLNDDETYFVGDMVTIVHKEMNGQAAVTETRHLVAEDFEDLVSLADDTL